jgi:hypothetical protein
MMLAAPKFYNLDLSTAAVPFDSGRYASARQVWCAYQDLIAEGNHQYFVET